MMLSKTQSKYIRSLALQKFRKEHHCFLAEGEKIVGEWLNTAQKIQLIAATEDWIRQHQSLLNKHPECTVASVDEAMLQQISCLQSPNKVVAVIPFPPTPDINNIQDWCIALDAIRDPGNMGTILRIADWFGIQHVACSPDCVDVFSPKVVQAAMGAHLRVNIYHTELLPFLQNTDLPAYAATLNGTNIYECTKSKKGILIIGNESFGISEDLIRAAKYKITIPRTGGAESLNAGVSAGILCALLLQP